jgi:hypothetical protein
MGSGCSIRQRAIPFDQFVESGLVTKENLCGMGMDFYPCLRIDFTEGENPRQYYVRIFEDNKILAIVRSTGYGYNNGYDNFYDNDYDNGYTRDANIGIQDVKILNYTEPYDPPIDFTFPDLPTVEELLPVPSDCADKDLGLYNLTFMANAMSKDDGLDCMSFYFAALGPIQQQGSTLGGSIDGALQGKYDVQYRWSSVGLTEMTLNEYRWGGLDCSGSQCEELNQLDRGTGEFAEVSVVEECPLKTDVYPCIKIDFLSSESRPRVHYARRVNSVTFISFTVDKEKANYKKATDVNVISQ